MSELPSIESIPHRDPFVFIDEVVSCDAERIVTRKLADPKAAFFQGHYPGNPVMPAVLLSECAFQAGALLIASRRGGYDASAGVPVITRIQDARFKRIVRPGDMVEIDVHLDEQMDNAYFLTARLSVTGKVVARLTFACMLALEDV